MVLYKNSNGVVISINAYVPDAIAEEIPDDTEEAIRYAGYTNRRIVHADGSVTYSIIPPEPKQTTTEELVKEVDKLNEIIDTLILSSLEGDDVQ